jgi:hypothetical protein
LLPAEVARQFGVIPVRVASDVALVATSKLTPTDAGDAIGKLLKRRIKFVRAEPSQVHRMIETYYPPAAQAG